MKNIGIILALWLGSMVGGGLYASEVVDEAKLATYAVWAPEGFDEDLLATVNTFVAKYSRLEPQFRGTYTNEAPTLADLLKGDLPELDQAFATIFIVNTPADKAVSLVDRERSIIGVNFAALSPAPKRMLTGRLERLFLREIANLAGVGKCPNGMCCLYNYNDFSQIDQMGRNFCPPCDLTYNKKMKSLNVPIPDYQALLMQKIKEMQEAGK